MAAIAAVHGIGKQQLGRQQLLGDWAPALGDGLERAIGRPVTPPPLDLAYYADLFLKSSGQGSDTKRPGTDTSEDEARLSLPEADEELEELAYAVQELVSAEDISSAEAAPPKGFTRVPKPLGMLLRACDWRYGPGSALLFVGEFRQVRQYLRDSVLKQAVDERVDASVAPDCRVLIGHSLGSVIAFEYVRRHGARRLDLLLTLGSPLGQRMVRSRMPNPDFGAVRRLPGGVARWVNVLDPHDPVTGGRNLVDFWPGVEDRSVDNQGDAHSVTRYLGKLQTGAALLDVLPGLAS
jgi:hypothetical protein